MQDEVVCPVLSCPAKAPCPAAPQDRTKFYFRPVLQDRTGQGRTGQ